MYKQDLEQTLLGIDEEAELEIGPRDDRPNVVLVGGSAFMLNDVTNRSVTHDIDVFEADRCLREIIARYPEVNGMAVAYCNQMPFNYEDRLIPLDIGARFIRYFTPSLEDLAVMKLYAYRPNDIIDLHSQAFVDRLDWGLLERLIFDEGEALASSPSERSYQEMVCAYKEKPNTFWAYPRARGWNRITETFYPCTAKRVAWRLYAPKVSSLIVMPTFGVRIER